MSEEGKQLMMKVAMRRKMYPKKCANILSNTLQIELNSLKSAVVELDDTENEIDIWQPSEKLKEEIANFEENEAKTMDIVNKEADSLLARLENIRKVLEQIKKGESSKLDVQMEKFCRERHSIESRKSKTTNKT